MLFRSILKETFEKYNLYELKERTKEIDLAYTELGYSLEKAKENARLARNSNSDLKQIRNIWGCRPWAGGPLPCGPILPVYFDLNLEFACFWSLWCVTVLISMRNKRNNQADQERKASWTRETSRTTRKVSRIKKEKRDGEVIRQFSLQKYLKIIFGML